MRGRENDVREYDMTKRADIVRNCVGCVNRKIPTHNASVLWYINSQREGRRASPKKEGRTK